MSKNANKIHYLRKILKVPTPQPFIANTMSSLEKS
jgi:hypothetical protein